MAEEIGPHRRQDDMCRPGRTTIREERAIETAAGSGRVPFISVGDVTIAAARLLTCPDPLDADYVLTGDQLLSYDDVAARIGAVLGEVVTHHLLSFDELAAPHRSDGLAERYAETLAFMDLMIAQGIEDRTTADFKQLVEAAPVTSDFASCHATTWERP